MLSAPGAAHHHTHHGHGEPCSGCADDEQCFDEDAELRQAVDEQLQQYLDCTGDDLPEDVLAGLSDLLVGVMQNGERR